jgi:hypothetical protein
VRVGIFRHPSCLVLHQRCLHRNLTGYFYRVAEHEFFHSLLFVVSRSLTASRMTRVGTPVQPARWLALEVKKNLYSAMRVSTRTPGETELFSTACSSCGPRLPYRKRHAEFTVRLVIFSPPCSVVAQLIFMLRPLMYLPAHIPCSAGKFFLQCKGCYTVEGAILRYTLQSDVFL